MGATAATVAPRVIERSIVMSSGRQFIALDNAPNHLQAITIDAELRGGLDERTDIGFRLTGGTGIVASYKRRLTSDPSAPATAVQLEGGLLAGLGDAMVGLTLLMSGREQENITPFGGLRVMAVAPMRDGYPWRPPTFGGYVGARIGARDLGLSSEIGLFHDRVANGTTYRSGWLLVPSVSLQLERMLSILDRPRR
jgi:hypothetical protein